MSGREAFARATEGRALAAVAFVALALTRLAFAPASRAFGFAPVALAGLTFARLAFARALVLATFDFALARRRSFNTRGIRTCSTGAGRVPAFFSSTARHKYQAAADLCGPQRSP